MKQHNKAKKNKKKIELAKGLPRKYRSYYRALIRRIGYVPEYTGEGDIVR